MLASEPAISTLLESILSYEGSMKIKHNTDLPQVYRSYIESRHTFVPGTTGWVYGMYMHADFAILP
jgi:hypothetical protein